MNSITRSLAINTYQFQQAPVGDRDFFESMQHRFGAEALAQHLRDLARILNAEIVKMSRASFEPYGASAAVLIGQLNSGLAHLDKSHVAVHTYLEFSDSSEWQSFRAEIEVSTCGELPILPLVEAIRKLFAGDFFTLDFRTRGVARDSDGRLCLAVDERSVPEFRELDQTSVRGPGGDFSATYVSRHLEASKQSILVGLLGQSR